MPCRSCGLTLFPGGYKSATGLQRKGCPISRRLQEKITFVDESLLLSKLKIVFQKIKDSRMDNAMKHMHMVLFSVLPEDPNLEEKTQVKVVREEDGIGCCSMEKIIWWI